ncbi:hypothetical protein ACQ86D_32975 [Streptomyces galilaeus]
MPTVRGDSGAARWRPARTGASAGGPATGDRGADAEPVAPTWCPSPAPVALASAFFLPGGAVCGALDPKLR